MTILFAGGEDVDFTIVVAANGYGFDTGKCRALWSRGGLTSRSGGVADPPDARFTTPNFAATTDFWTHCWIYPTVANNSSLNQQFMRWLDASGVCRLALRLISASGQFKLSTRNAAGTFVDLVTSTTGWWNTGVIFQIDVHINYVVSGSVNVYINSVLALTYSGDVTTNSATQLAAFGFATMDGNHNNIDSYTSEVIVATTDTRAMNLWTMNGTTAGNAQAWTGTASNPNALFINDAAFISSPTANQIQEYKTPTLTQPAGTYTVEAVVNSYRADNGATGPQNIQLITRIATTDYFSASQLLTTSFVNYASLIQPTNPATAAAWTTTDLASSNYQYGVKSIT